MPCCGRTWRQAPWLSAFAPVQPRRSRRGRQPAHAAPGGTAAARPAHATRRARRRRRPPVPPPTRRRTARRAAPRRPRCPDGPLERLRHVRARPRLVPHILCLPPRRLRRSEGSPPHSTGCTASHSSAHARRPRRTAPARRQTGGRLCSLPLRTECRSQAWTLARRRRHPRRPPKPIALQRWQRPREPRRWERPERRQRCGHLRPRRRCGAAWAQRRRGRARAQQRRGCATPGQRCGRLWARLHRGRPLAQLRRGRLLARQRR